MNTETLAKTIESLAEPFPPEAIKSRVIGGGRRADYVTAATVIRRLNKATNCRWNFTVDRYWIEGSLSYALGTLTIDGLGCRQHIGVQSLDSKSGEDAAAKGAISDALKKAATLFGVGLDLYGPDYEEEEPRRQEPPKTVERVRAREAAPVAEDAPVSPLEAAMRAFAAEAGAQILANPDDPNSRPSKSKMMRLAAEVTGGLVCESPQDWNKATAALMRRKETAIGGVD